MITEIELSEIVSQLASKSKKQIEIYKYSYLRSIGDYIEKNDSSCRVSMNTCSYHTFQSRSPRRIVVEEERIIVRGLQTPIMKAVISQYTPNKRVAEKIEEAIKKLKVK